MIAFKNLWNAIKRLLGLTSGPKPRGLRCGNCGADLTSQDFCRSCGASEESGWGDGYVGEEEEQDFDYDDFVRSEFGDGKSRHAGVASSTWGAMLLIILACGMLLAQFGGLLF